MDSETKKTPFGRQCGTACQIDTMIENGWSRMVKMTAFSH
jgi:hypothetical protein